MCHSRNTFSVNVCCCRTFGSSAISVPVSLSTGNVPSVGRVMTPRNTSILTVMRQVGTGSCMLAVQCTVTAHCLPGQCFVCVLLKNRNRAPQHVNTSGLPQTFTFKHSNALQRHRRRRRRRRPPPPPPPPMLPQTTTREATTNTQTKAYSKTSSGVVALCEPGGGPGRPNSECSVSVAFGALIFETFSLTKWGSWRG